MRLLAAVILLWIATEVLEGGAGLSPLALWGVWTSGLYLCVAAAYRDGYLDQSDRLSGLAGGTLLAAYYVVMQSTYLAFIPANADHQNLWPTIYLVVNLAGPLALVPVGIVRHSIQRWED